MTEKQSASCSDQTEAIAQLCKRLALSDPVARMSEALTHPSYANERHSEAEVDNQRLEFLGDSVLALCASELLMEAFEGAAEGILTVMRASLVNTNALAAAARELEVADGLRLGRGADTAGERFRDNVLADTVEAIVGAVYLDCGMEAARRVCRTIVGSRFDELVRSGGIQRDAKSRLQELAQARGLDTPTYSILAEEGPPHARNFTVEVMTFYDKPIENETEGPAAWARARIVAEGVGRTKKAAEQAAAAEALKKIDAGSVDLSQKQEEQ